MAAKKKGKSQKKAGSFSKNDVFASAREIEYEYQSPERLKALFDAELDEGELRENLKVLVESTKEAVESRMESNEKKIQRPPGYKWENKAK